MRRTKRSKKQMIIGIISSIVLVLTIGYSFLSLNLRISGLAHIGAIWNIHFDNIQINPDSKSLSVGDIEPEIDEDNDCKINYKVTLTPGDFYEFNFDIVNEGTIDGMIQNIITRIEEDATATFPSYIDYHISYSDDVVLETNQQLLAGTTETLKVRVEFKDEENVPESETLDLSYESNYVKKTSSATKVKHPQPLYNVLQDEANSGSGLAVQYTGDHHDSFTEEPSKNIYHWYASKATNGMTILNKNNVIFANHCWQMIRTTDTGGVKLLYNGEAENNQCLDTRGTHNGYSGYTTLNLYGSYWYGTDYTYDSTSQLFSIAGSTEQSTWNDTTSLELVGKYTCKSTTENGTCTTLYLIDSYINSSNAYVITLKSNSNYSQFGSLQFNYYSKSPTYAGYMYGDDYTFTTTSNVSSQSFYTTVTRFSNSIKCNDNFLYSKTINNTGSNYELVDPILGSEIPEDSCVGYYTFNSSSTVSGNSPYYIVGYKNDSYYYFVSLSISNNIDLSFYYLVVGDSIIDNLDGTYTLSGATYVSPTEWYTNHSNYVRKYICGGTASTTCTRPVYITSTANNQFKYVIANEKIIIAKERNDLSLVDTKLIRKDEWFNDYQNYSDYKYTCNTDNVVCTEESLRMITNYSSTGYSYLNIHFYGEIVTWDGENYTLENPIEMENYNNLNNLSTHHYFCVDNGLKTCSTVGYIYNYTGSGIMYYITLKDGVTSISQALNNMFAKNTTNSTIKSGVDAWYKHFLYNDYDQYIEDSIFCNDRSIREIAGWDDRGGMTNSDLHFKEYTLTTDLICSNITDQFSVSNNSAQLTYKVGLISAPEMAILNNGTIRQMVNYSWWLASPHRFDYLGVRGIYVSGLVGIASSSIKEINGVRPSISLIPGIKYTDGDGSMANPYIIKTN